MESIKHVTDKLETPSIDDRTYRVIHLPNGLEVLLAHDATTDDAGACLVVEVGSMSDEIPGMAHALEHLVLRGTKKYPGENDFNAYILSHAGEKNASTYPKYTNYYFKVNGLPTNREEPTATNPSPLRGALDHLAGLAIDPLLREETIERELHAVDSEYKLNLQKDRWRLLQLERSTANPKHPWNHFCIGNLKVLKEEPESRGISVRDALLAFFNKKYSANRMKLCVLGREPISCLETWVMESFSRIPNKELALQGQFDEPPFTRESLGTQSFVLPVMTFRELTLAFPYLDETDLYKEQPSEYITHLICHKGPGSLMAYLKDKGWATSIFAATTNVCVEGVTFFRCYISVTPEGREKYKEIVNAFFLYISLLREKGPQERIFNEVKRMSELRFRFKEKVPVIDFTTLISARMQEPIPREWLLSAACLRTFDPALITIALECLRPENLRLTIVSPEGTWDKTEAWFGTRYRSEPIPAAFMSELSRALASSANDRPAEFYLPRDNPFLPANTEVKPGREPCLEEKLRPEIVRHDNKARTWWMDSSFGVPKAYFVALLRSPLLFGSAENITKAYLFQELVEDKLMKSAHEAELSGFSYDISTESRGLRVYIGGYNDKIADLLKLIVDTIKDLEIQEDRFNIIKEKAVDSYRNGDFIEPYRQTMNCTWWLTTDRTVSLEQQAAQLPDIDLESLRRFKSTFLSQLHIEVYAHGNLDRDEARSLTAIIELSLGSAILPQADWPVRRSLGFTPGSNYRYERELADPAEVNNCIEYWICVGSREDDIIRSKTHLMCQLVRKTAFDWLRTKLKLGYVVFTSDRTTYTVRGLSIIVQGERTCSYMEKCIVAFLKTYAKWLVKMSDSEFETEKRSLIARLLKKPKNLHESYDNYWAQIDDEYYNFPIAEDTAASVESLTRTDMVAFYEQYINPASPQCARFVVNLKSQVKPSNSDVNGNVFAGENGAMMTVEDIKQHLLKNLKVDEAEVEDGVELWREICMRESEAGETDMSHAIKIDDAGAFKDSLSGLAPPVRDLSKFEQQC